MERGINVVAVKFDKNEVDTTVRVWSYSTIKFVFVVIQSVSDEKINLLVCS